MFCARWKWVKPIFKWGRWVKWKEIQEEGIYVRGGWFYFAVQQKLIQHCKTTIFQLKQNKRPDPVVPPRTYSGPCCIRVKKSTHWPSRLHSSLTLSLVTSSSTPFQHQNFCQTWKLCQNPFPRYPHSEPLFLPCSNAPSNEA